MLKPRRTFSAICSLVLASLLLVTTALAEETQPGGSFLDGTQTRISYGQNARRIVSLMPNVTEELFFLGFGKRVVGRSDFCNYPPEAAALPSVGGMVDTSLESIIALQPDLVVAYQGNSLDLVRDLRNAGLNVVAFKEAASLSDIGQQMHQLYKVAAKAGADSPEALTQWDARLARALKQRGQYKSQPSVYYGYPGEMSYSAAPGSFIDDLIKLAGGRNVVDSEGERWPQVSAEYILSAQPQFMLVGTPCTTDGDIAEEAQQIRGELRHDPVWSKLPAVKNSHVVVLDSDVLLRPGPRILDALDSLRAALAGGGAAQ